MSFQITFTNMRAAEQFAAVADMVIDIHREADDILLAERIEEIADMVQIMIDTRTLRTVTLGDELRDAADGIREDMATLAGSNDEVTISAE
jgi:hypothetical protein